MLFFFLSQLVPPEYVKSLAQQTYISEGSSNYSLICKVISNPVGSLSWFANETQITANSNEWNILETKNQTDSHAELQSVLTLNSISKKHFGNYTCLARNEIGQVSSRQILIVTCKYTLLDSVLNCSSLCLFCSKCYNKTKDQSIMLAAFHR